MAGVRQMELFGAGGHAWKDTVLRRLPGTDFLGVIDVALAFGVSQTKVVSWIEEGRLEAANLNAGIAGRRSFYRIPRTGVLDFIERIQQGI